MEKVVSHVHVSGHLCTLVLASQVEHGRSLPSGYGPQTLSSAHTQNEITHVSVDLLCALPPFAEPPERTGSDHRFSPQRSRPQGNHEDRMNKTYLKDGLWDIWMDRLQKVKHNLSGVDGEPQPMVNGPRQRWGHCTDESQHQHVCDVFSVGPPCRAEKLHRCDSKSTRPTLQQGYSSPHRQAAPQRSETRATMVSTVHVSCQSVVGMMRSEDGVFKVKVAAGDSLLGSEDFRIATLCMHVF